MRLISRRNKKIWIQISFDNKTLEQLEIIDNQILLTYENTGHKFSVL
jgi:hypothetical protein